MPVNTPSREYMAAIEVWSRCRDCYEGSDAVKAQGQKYLPPLPSHKKNVLGYSQYLLRALFFNAMGRTVDGLAGSIFQKPPRWELTEEAAECVADVTLTGVTGEMFALRTTRNILTTGRWGILVDMSSEENEEVPARPYFVGYRAEDIISWGTELVGGDQQLRLVVLREFTDVTNEKDPFIRDQVEQYRVLRLVKNKYTQELWQKSPNGDFVKAQKDIVPERRGEPLDFIPFVFMSAIGIEPTIEKPPLIDLVDVNLSHYRTMADLEHGRHYTALPTPWVQGAVQGDTEEDLAIGSGVAWVLEKGGGAGMLEFSGAGLASLVTADQEKRKMMATLGARLLEDIGGAETATAVSMRHSGDHATLRTIAAVLEQGLTRALQWLEWWIGTEETPDEVESSIQLNKEFFAAKASPADISTALQALQAEQISFQTFYNVLLEGGWSREGIDAEQERKDIEADRKLNQKAALEAQAAFAAVAPPEGAPAPGAEGTVPPEGEVPPDGEVPPEGAPEGEVPEWVQSGDELVGEGDDHWIISRGGKFLVVRVDDGKVMGKFASKKEADAKLSSLEGGEDEEDEEE